VYDMYSWDEARPPADEHAEAAPRPQAAPAGHPAPPAEPAERAAPAARAAQAVQVALDRRDNGGAADPVRSR
jgi:hypothetical protein